MVETFSTSLFMDSTLGGVLAFVGFLVTFVASLAAWAWFMDRAKLFDRVGVGFKILRPASFVLILLGCGAVYLAGTSGLSHGDIEAVRVQHLGGERVLQVSVSWRTGGRGPSRTHEAIKVFTMDGKLVGSRRTTNASGGRGPVEIGRVGHAVVLQGDDRLLIVDPLSQETLVDVRKTLDRAHGADRYRIKGVSLPHVEVELVDGSSDRFDMSALPATRDLPALTDSFLVVGGDTCWAENAREGASHDGTSLEVEGILRGRWLQRPRRSRSAQLCVVELEQSAWLALHRSTAFGDEGRHLLSALAVDSAGEPLWTVDLEPALGRLGTARYEIYSPELRGAELCLWLVRGRRSLSELCLDARTGEIRSAKVVL